MGGQTTEEKKDRNRKTRTVFYIFALMILLILSVTATYTWFALSASPRVSDMALYVSTATGLEIAGELDAPEDDWGVTLDYMDFGFEKCPLKPATWSEKEQSLISVNYGLDGRASDTGKKLTDEQNANRTDANGYYVTGTFYARTDQTCAVRLADAATGLDGSYVFGRPVWNPSIVRHDDRGFGAETAIRIGFRVTLVDPESGEPKGDPVFYVYEPNGDSHEDGSDGYVGTPSIDGADSLVPLDRLMVQKTSSWTENSPVLNGTVLKTVGNLETQPVLFTLDSQSKAEIRFIIWLEGQDEDCISRIDDAELSVNLQFETDYGSQTGFEDIPDQ